MNDEEEFSHEPDVHDMPSRAVPRQKKEIVSEIDLKLSLQALENTTRSTTHTQKFKFEGNSTQHSFNSLRLDEIFKVKSFIERGSLKAALKLLGESEKALKELNKVKRIADKYARDVVEEYIDDPLTDNSEDATKLRQAEFRAKAKRRDKARLAHHIQKNHLTADPPTIPRTYTPSPNTTVERRATSVSIATQKDTLPTSAQRKPQDSNPGSSTKTRFQFSYWKDLQAIQNPSLRDFASKLPNIGEASKSKNTVKKYACAFKRFCVWCANYDLCPLPASVTTVAVYLSFLIQSEVSASVLNCAFYGIKWEHDLNLYSNVFSNDFLSIVLEGGVRLLSKPINKKEPITYDIIKRVIDKFGSSTNL
ncbi:unnamed protein product [Mytilus coruscus]|uniref:Uncharacterized protein n=1 Tax=Mytilus coruscus TaxID=42192 RepID=A0A6J8AAA7_MYTCO|nr:unnamed protein product [Mytilus coruscus]